MNPNQIHFVLQGKGGVGKSWTAALIAQVLQALDANLLCIDTDPVNQTLHRYSALPVRPLEILTADQQIDARRFDDMVEWLLAHDGAAVIDNGATSFVPATAYLAETGALDVLAAAGRPVLLHTVLVGGQGMADTLVGLHALLKSTTAPVVVWENEFWGPVEQDGKRFIDGETYATYRNRIAGIVTLRSRNAATYGRDIAAMTTASTTFAQALADPAFGTMPRHRLQQVWTDIASQLTPILKGVPA